MSSNPSHLLISRNPPRSPAHPQLDPTLTSRHLSSPSHNRNSSGRWVYAEDHPSRHPSEDETAKETELEDEGPIDVHPTFQCDAELPGKIKVIVGRNEFWCHKEVLWFASPFFEGLLSGNWAESNPLHEDVHSRPSTVIETDVSSSDVPDVDSMTSKLAVESKIITDQPDIASMTEKLENNEVANVTTKDLELNHSQDKQGQYSAIMSDEAEEASSLREVPQHLTNTPVHRALRDETGSTTQVISKRRDRTALRASFSSSLHRSQNFKSSPLPEGPETVVELHEESASAFQDFLFWAYPHLECKVTWTNVAPLLSLASKLIVPCLQKLCIRFLLTHASGRPIMALALAEQHGNAELYREASRFVLDQPTWDENEMKTLSVETQLKLSNRSRLDCPDPSKCQAQLDDKWRQAHHAVIKYGPPQPSVAFRCLRQLETFPTNPSLVMPHALCQWAAKAWVMSLFDRMFQLKIVHSANPGTEKYWLWISMT
ncbi:hypothetical protein I309_01828 [Cryptococcus deuterogattii LA55]|nr:hypothetical protein I309_01828 [Cryptococcus deuterogattii LA55]KIR71776.1 hypothetical protein I310_04456 [Cryptococcus deuterogattii CA1014]KIR91358.1 hypothetical protein I304_04829 [Cryptococcus deuterogattii CBS 10090]